MNERAAISSTTASPNGPAPADARPHAAWPTWKRLLAYAALSSLAAAAIWFIDLRAHRPPATPPEISQPDSRPDIAR
jgi:hypothetical protein